MSSYFIQEYQEDLEDEDEDSEVELVVQVLILYLIYYLIVDDNIGREQLLEFIHYTLVSPVVQLVKV